MRIFTFLLLFNVCALIWAESTPEWLIPLREAVYEQKLNSEEVRPIYQRARRAAHDNLSGAPLNVALSRCEYLMGRVLDYEKQNDRALTYYEEGKKFAEKAIEIRPSAEAWVMVAENLSHIIPLRNWTYTLANGLDVEKFSKNALALNKRNAAAQIMIAARWVYAPAMFRDLPKGIDMMQKVLTEGDLDKDDYFNVYVGIGYGNIQQKNNSQARSWLLKALEIYPTNKYAAELLSGL